MFCGAGQSTAIDHGVAESFQPFGELGLAEDGDGCCENGVGGRPVTHIRAREGPVDRDHVTADDPA
jgi:hypothetical protein